MRLCAFLFVVICFLFRFYDRFGDSHLRVTFLDVGQGDAILIQFPRGRTLLIDAGGGIGGQDMGSLQIIPELAQRGILTLDTALLTHPDWDHGAGFRSVLQDLRVRELWLHADAERLPNPTGLLKKLLELAASRDIQVRRFLAPTEIDWGMVRLRLLPVRTSDRKANNHSLVLELVGKGCRLLFLGDLEKAGEAELLKLRSGLVDVLKVAHHGSKTSSQPALISSLRPQLAAISAGLLNSYGHPALSPVLRLRGVQAEILRTDFHGAIELRVEQGRIECQTSQGDCGVIFCRDQLATPN